MQVQEQPIINFFLLYTVKELMLFYSFFLTKQDFISKSLEFYFKYQKRGLISEVITREDPQIKGHLSHGKDFHDTYCILNLF